MKNIAAGLLMIPISFSLSSNAFADRRENRDHCSVDWFLANENITDFIIKGSALHNREALERMRTLKQEGFSVMTNLDPLGIPRYKSITAQKFVEKRVPVEKCAATHSVSIEEICTLGMHRKKAMCRERCYIESSTPDCP